MDYRLPDFVQLEGFPEYAKCENCGGRLLVYDRTWWELVSWADYRSTWRPHTPARCRERRASGWS